MLVQVQVGEAMFNQARCVCKVHLELVKHYL